VQRTLAILSLSVAIGASLLAQPSRLGTERPEVLRLWQERLAATDQALRAAEWDTAMKVLIHLVPEMANRIESGEGARSLFAAAAMYRALAHAGLGDLDRAEWDYGIALALHPGLVEADLSPYGEAGRHLAESRSRTVEVGGRPSEPAGELAPPKKLRGKDPQYPFAKRNACLEGPVLVEFVIDEQGLLRSPSLPKPTDPVLTFVVLDTLRTWRYRPASRNGQPMPVRFVLTVNFGIEVCRNPLAVPQRTPGDG
jgi:TonB family protein